ncbi:hypothetical protein HDU77_000511 [Chytriomyces hyalinus]|nr:hypothetical protein HDU77_000511 [Chytriomyces hyalinus]
MPESPHTVQIRPEIKKGDNPYAPNTPSQLSGAKRAENQIVDYEIVKRHLKSQKMWHDSRLESKNFVKSCHRLGVCTEEDDQIFKRSMIEIKWRGVAFKLDDPPTALLKFPPTENPLQPQPMPEESPDVPPPPSVCRMGPTEYAIKPVFGDHKFHNLSSTIPQLPVSISIPLLLIDQTE